MNLPAGLRAFARWGRSVLLPIGSVRQHLRSLVNKTGKDLRFENSILQQLEIEADSTLHEMGIKQ